MPHGMSVIASRAPCVSGTDIKNVRVILDPASYPRIRLGNSINDIIFEIGSGKMPY